MRTLKQLLAEKQRPLAVVTPKDSVFHALSVMAEHNVGALLVLDGEQLVGIFSERDYARKIILLGRSSRDTTVGEVMSYPATSVTPQDTVQDCLRMMTTYRLRHLVVVEDARPVGMVSIGDLMNWIMSAQEDMIGHLHSYISGNYLG